MFQVRIHGRGGQGAVTAAELLSVAAFMEGHYAPSMVRVEPATSALLVQERSMGGDDDGEGVMRPEPGRGCAHGQIMSRSRSGRRRDTGPA
jgi:hypothetical protein